MDGGANTSSLPICYVRQIDLHTAVNAVLQDVYSPSGSVSSSRSDATWPGVASLAPSLTLEQLGCKPGDVIDILVRICRRTCLLLV